MDARKPYSKLVIVRITYFCVVLDEGTALGEENIPQVELGNITILLYIMILKCHDNWYRREIFSIVISAVQYYRQYCDYHNIYCS